MLPSLIKSRFVYALRLNINGVSFTAQNGSPFCSHVHCACLITEIKIQAIAAINLQ